jgi:hypothetical protein
MAASAGSDPDGPVRPVAPGALADFAGPWLVERRIEDRLAGRIVAGAGQALLAGDGAGGLRYDETLTLHHGGPERPLTGVRTYLWAQAGDHVEVRFSDGRRFHRFALGVAITGDVHDCAPDRYAGRYDFARWPDWQVQWEVAGPRKNYRMVTRYRRPG